MKVMSMLAGSAALVALMQPTGANAQVGPLEARVAALEAAADAPKAG